MARLAPNVYKALLGFKTKYVDQIKNVPKAKYGLMVLKGEDQSTLPQVREYHMVYNEDAIN